ncbi:baseplate J/gp47 family protein [Candidatus Uhrbacteria bacterium]|nr:baseplate J/gp47 family protein [Candidatus Uhrbacteria bacterium]
MAQFDETMMPSPAAPSLAVYRRIALAFLLLTVVVAGAVAYFAYAKATVVILSNQEDVRTDFIVDVAKKPAVGEVAGGVYEVAETVTNAFPSTSFAEVSTPATGRVKIINGLSRSQALVQRTRLLTPAGILFRIKESVTVPAGGSVEVDVFADQPGPAGDVGTATFTIPGLAPDLQKKITAETVTPITGGTKEVRMVTTEDLEGAHAVLKERMARDLADRLRAKAQDDKVPMTGEIITIDVVGRTSDKAVGSEAETFTVSTTVRATGVFYDKDAFDARVSTRLKEAVAAGRAILRYEIDKGASLIEKRDLVAGRANIHVFARGTTVLAVSSPALDPEKLAGISVDAAVTYLQKVPGVSSASIRATPFWSGRMPNAPERIKVEVR